jgi:hypothetical protein
VAAQLVASRAVLSSTELVSEFRMIIANRSRKLVNTLHKNVIRRSKTTMQCFLGGENCKVGEYLRFVTMVH